MRLFAVVMDKTWFARYAAKRFNRVTLRKFVPPSGPRGFPNKRQMGASALGMYTT